MAVKEPFSEEMKEKGAFCETVCDQKFMKKWSVALYFGGVILAIIAWVFIAGSWAGEMTQWRGDTDKKIQTLQDNTAVAVENGKKLDRIIAAMSDPRRRP